MPPNPLVNTVRANAPGLANALNNAPIAISAGLLQDSDPAPIEINVNLAGTFLETDPTDPAVEASFFSLEDLSLAEGQSFYMWMNGDWSYGEESLDENSQDVIAVFVDANGNFLEPGEGTTASEVETNPTFPAGNSTDIEEDFLISETVEVVVPEGAAGLYVSVNDSYWDDNSDPDGDFHVYVDPELTYNGDETVFFWPFDWTSSYYYPDPEDGANAAGPGVIDLTSLGLEAGDVFEVTSIGEWSYGAGQPDENTEYTMVFADDEFNFIAPGEGTTAEGVVTSPIDFSEDMLLNGTEYLVVPEGATQLLLGVNDTYYSDNQDYDSDTGVFITIHDGGDSIA